MPHGLRSFLRQDPNIILVGEIRDHETADLAIQASLTGHLVFSTFTQMMLRGTPPTSGYGRRAISFGFLDDLPLLPKELSGKFMINVRKLTYRKCKVVEEMKKELGALWQPSGEVKLYKGKGDEDCGNSGYYGRIGIFEVIPLRKKSVN